MSERVGELLGGMIMNTSAAENPLRHPLTASFCLFKAKHCVPVQK